MSSAHDVALGSTGWRLWREACLRSAGFPARQVLRLCDDELARAADGHDQSPAAAQAYTAAYRRAVERLPGVIAGLAQEPRFREAVLWQNPDIAVNWLDGLTPAAPRSRKGRRRELTVTSYLQRYCLKNDTIGFFGPVGWASVAGPDGPADGPGSGLAVVPGDGLLARRTTYFEVWAVDQVAKVIAARPEVAGWLRPRRNPDVLLAGNTLHRPRRKPVTLSPAQVRMLLRCDGGQTVSDLLAAPEPDGPALLTELEAAGAVRIDLAGPVQAWPERWLREQLELIGDAGIRAAALRPLDELIAARDAVATAAGDPDKLEDAVLTLGQTFERVTKMPPARRPGGIYAGRTPVYEDAVRDVEIGLGSRLTAALAPPLGLVLDSARWLVAEITARYRQRFRQLLETECRRAGTDRIPLLRLLSLAMPELLPSSGTTASEIVTAALGEFQQRWLQVLDLPPEGPPRHSVRAADIAAAVAERFPARPAAWSCARQHSPDIMIAAASADAVHRGEYLLVLGELHLAVNTLESRCFVEQHADPARLLDAVTADHGGRRIVAVPPRDSPVVTSRVNPPTALLSPRYTYWTAGNDAVLPPEAAPVLPAAGLLVGWRDDDLVVSCVPSGAELPFFEVVADIIGGAVGNAFHPVAPRPHRPRITIDRLVLSREAWTLSFAAASWASIRDEARRYALARRWRREHGLPERIFYRVPTEAKPMAADFRSLPLVNLLARSIRGGQEAGFASFSATEMLPDTGQLWLPDAAGERYSCELRMVATAPEGNAHAE
jgi:hypothetical protein